MEHSIQLVIRALQLIVQCRQQTGNAERQSEATEVAALCQRFVEEARAAGLHISDNNCK